MDLFEQLSEGREDKALDRLVTMLSMYAAQSEIEQNLALERAIVYCDREWGSYSAGLEALALRIETHGAGDLDAAMEALRLREEGDNPGSLIQAERRRRNREMGRLGERDSVIAFYGSEEAVTSPTSFEMVFIAAARHLAEVGSENDPFAPLDGWHLPWHDLPQGLSDSISSAYPLPATVVAARDECLKWQERLRHLELLFECPGSGMLPTACAARLHLVERLWRREAEARSLPDFSARLDYWASKGGEDGSGYAVLARDLAVISTGLLAVPPTESTKEKARRLKTENPEWSLATIGKQLGISRQAVHKHLKGFHPS